MKRRSRHLKQNPWRRRRTILGSYPAPAGSPNPVAAAPLEDAEARTPPARPVRERLAPARPLEAAADA